MTTYDQEVALQKKKKKTFFEASHKKVCIAEFALLFNLI